MAAISTMWPTESLTGWWRPSPLCDRLSHWLADGHLEATLIWIWERRHSPSHRVRPKTTQFALGFSLSITNPSTTLKISQLAHNLDIKSCAKKLKSNGIHLAFTGRCMIFVLLAMASTVQCSAIQWSGQSKIWEENTVERWPLTGMARWTRKGKE